MKIEKISDTQIKFLLTHEDLKERKIKLSELAQGSEKAQAFFRDIMTEAMIDCGFDASNTPLIIEAMPVSIDSVMIIVSKVGKEGENNEKVSLLPKSLDYRKFKQKDIDIIENQFENNNDTCEDSENVYIYSFDTFEDLTALAERLHKVYSGKSYLYKYEERYFLLLEKNISLLYEIEYIIFEYGQKHISTLISKYHIFEHGELIIKNNAIDILASL